MKRHAILPLGSLKPPEVLLQTGRFEVPAYLKSALGGGSLNLPNASLCADFLVLPSREIIGVCVGVSASDLSLVRHLFRGSHPERVVLRDAGSSIPIRYSAYPASNWLEVCWKEASRADIVEAQSNQVLWYLSNESSMCVGAMVLEDLAYIEAEVEGGFEFDSIPESGGV